MNSSPEPSQVTSKTSQVTSPEALLDGLDNSQREAATALEGTSAHYSLCRSW